ncbi:hypothetical protein [Epilithonimonas xixisoli]|uniref:Uncharacterized protein n=1 Tax=Epilithonimonas xixisoli TaxID=1476462 RepID=A0A4R8I9F6_9FLAO|nr:hypothetical protein [Epilithonimonas xixisoli]TDX86130.1 hypothetical protein B0I22_0238 [Epilithonimonas xixisoli]
MKTINEILIWGIISVIVMFLLNVLLENILPRTFNFWIYDSLSSLIISLVLIILFLILKKECAGFELFLRYSFANFLIITVYNFVYALKISFDEVRFCVQEKISNEQLYQACFASNFLVFISTLFFLILFKEKNVTVFTKNSVIYMIMVLILILVFRAQVLFAKTIDSILTIL